MTDEKALIESGGELVIGNLDSPCGHLGGLRAFYVERDLNRSDPFPAFIAKLHVAQVHCDLYVEPGGIRWIGHSSREQADLRRVERILQEPRRTAPLHRIWPTHVGAAMSKNYPKRGEAGSFS